jgi:hypothetical protein
MKDYSRKPLINGEMAVQHANARRTPRTERSLAAATHGLYCFSQYRSPKIFHCSLLIANYSLLLACHARVDENVATFFVMLAAPVKM